MSKSRPEFRSIRRTVLGTAAASVVGLSTLGGLVAGAGSGGEQTGQVVTMGAEAGKKRVTLYGTMADFAGHESVWAGFTYKKKGTMSGSIGEEIKLWNPTAAPAQLPPDDQEGPAFSLTFVYGEEGVSEESEEWRLKPGNTYTYQAQARLPDTIGSVPIQGEPREFTIPSIDE